MHACLRIQKRSERNSKQFENVETCCQSHTAEYYQFKNYCVSIYAIQKRRNY